MSDNSIKVVEYLTICSWYPYFEGGGNHLFSSDQSSCCRRLHGAVPKRYCRSNIGLKVTKLVTARFQEDEKCRVLKNAGMTYVYWFLGTYVQEILWETSGKYSAQFPDFQISGLTLILPRVNFVMM